MSDLFEQRPAKRSRVDEQIMVPVTGVSGVAAPIMTLNMPDIDKTLFERIRDELDEHHDRRERVVKASRDITGLSKKIIFSLQRVKTFAEPLPPAVDREVKARLSEIAKLLRNIAPDLQDLNRYRYARQFSGLEELVEALTFSAYVQTARLLSPEETQRQINDLIASAPNLAPDAVASDDANPQQDPLTIHLDEDDYINGVFDLTGEIMRFATTNRQFVLPFRPKSTDATPSDDRGPSQTLSVVRDMQLLESMFRLLPPPNRHSDGRYTKAFAGKMEVLLASVHKVEVLAYGLAVRGSERPEGWVPDVEERGDDD